MRASFYKCFGSSSAEPSATLETRMAEFYEAEKDAFDPQAVKDSFASVGLHPWDKPKIFRLCRENCPVDPESDVDSMLSDLAMKISMYSEMQTKGRESLRSSVKHAGVATPKKPERRPRPKKDTSENQVQEGTGGSSSSSAKTMSDSLEVPNKRSRLMHVDRKTCASKGCQKTHFWSKKWVSCPKCKKNFCEEHKDELYHHHC